MAPGATFAFDQAAARLLPSRTHFWLAGRYAYQTVPRFPMARIRIVRTPVPRSLARSAPGSHEIADKPSPVVGDWA